jgi:hypothetical protein
VEADVWLEAAELTQAAHVDEPGVEATVGRCGTGFLGLNHPDQAKLVVDVIDFGQELRLGRAVLVGRALTLRQLGELAAHLGSTNEVVLFGPGTCPDLGVCVRHCCHHLCQKDR